MTTQTEALKLLVEALSLYETRTDGLVNKALAAGKEALAQPKEPEQEPVAWWFNFPDKRIRPKFDTVQHGGDWKPLYTHPQPKAEQSPLTDEAIGLIVKQHIAEGTRSFEVFTRAIEKAHGIGDKA